MASLGFLYDRIRPDEKALINAARSKGVRVHLIDCKKAVFDVAGPMEPMGFGVAVQRCVSLLRYLHSTAILEGAGIRVVNPSAVALTCGNKLLTTLALAKAGVPTPRTRVAFTVDSALRALDRIGYPAILKPIIGSWGRLVALLKDPDSARSVLESWDQMGTSWYRVYYLQEYVALSRRDIRCVAIGDDVVAAIYRYAPPGEWRSNLARGGRGERCEVTDELRELSLKVAEAVGGGVLGVDLMETREGLVVHEVNHNVEFRRTVPITGVDIPSLIVDYALGLVRR